MAFSKEKKEEILKEIKEKCGNDGLDVTNALLDMGEDMGHGLVLIGFKINLLANEHELHVISDVLSYLKNENPFAYKMLERTLIDMFHRKSEVVVKDFLNQQKRNSDGESN